MTQENQLIDFVPHPWLPGAHLQTILGYYLPSSNELDQAKVHQVNVSEGDTIVVCENKSIQNTPPKGCILLMHGLGGQAGSTYMLRLASVFCERGWVAFRMNHRGCGEGRGLARKLYHAGRSEDISKVLARISELYPETSQIAVGFSLSGNALLKLLGEQKDPIPANLCGAVAVNPPIVLAMCADALSRKSNWLYDFRFVRLLKQAIREHQNDFVDFPSITFPWKLTLRQFDDLYTAPLSGFESADDYYKKCSAKPFLSHISLPTMILASEDDPFIPNQTFDDIPNNENLNLKITRGGGHMGFICADKTPLGTHRWMDYAILNYAESLMKNLTRPSRSQKRKSARKDAETLRTRKVGD
jgi:predicted alpha/beta-fold hydrolase